MSASAKTFCGNSVSDAFQCQSGHIIRPLLKQSAMPAGTQMLRGLPPRQVRDPISTLYASMPAMHFDTRSYVDFSSSIHLNPILTTELRQS